MAIVIGSTSAGTLGTLTVADIKSIIQAQGYGTDTTGVQTTMLRYALRTLYGQRRWRFARQSSLLFSATVANAGVVDISTLGRGIMPHTVRVSIGTDYEDLKHVDVVELERERFIDRTLGFPRRWSRTADSLLVYPRPDNTYPLEIVYQALLTLPSADGDTVMWPETHIEVLVAAVCVQLARRQRDAQAEANSKQDLADALVRMMRDDEFTDTQTDLEVGHWDGWRQGGVELP
jgi:hypothetical protein